MNKHTGSPGDHEALFVASHLTYSRASMQVIDDIGFTLSAGQLLEVVGENGSGKTTLLRIACGFIEPDAGEIRWRGRNIHSYINEYLHDVTYIGHLNGIKADLTPFENLAVDYALSSRPADVPLADIIDNFGLASCKDVPVRKLSSGQRRRVALARLRVSGARLWLLDEPYASLDEGGRRLISDLLREHLLSGGMAIMASHDFIPMNDVSITRISL